MGPTKPHTLINYLFYESFTDINNTNTVNIPTITGGFGAAIRRHTDPYGNPIGTPTGTWLDHNGYLSQPQNTTTGLTHLGPRQYDPTQGKFLTVDPILTPYAPQQNNGYTYGWNNPQTHPDASGKDPCIYCVDPAGTGDNQGTTPAGQNCVYCDAQTPSAPPISTSGTETATTTSPNTLKTKTFSILQSRYNGSSNIQTNGYGGSYWYPTAGDEDGSSGVVCFGRLACNMAFLFTLSHPGDVSDAQAIAANYCTQNFDRCITDANEWYAAKTMASSLPLRTCLGGR